MIRMKRTKLMALILSRSFMQMLAMGLLHGPDVAACVSVCAGGSASTSPSGVVPLPGVASASAGTSSQTQEVKEIVMMVYYA